MEVDVGADAAILDVVGDEVVVVDFPVFIADDGVVGHEGEAEGVLLGHGHDRAEAEAGDIFDVALAENHREFVFAYKAAQVYVGKLVEGARLVVEGGVVDEHIAALAYGQVDGVEGGFAHFEFAQKG